MDVLYTNLTTKKCKYCRKKWLDQLSVVIVVSVKTVEMDDKKVKAIIVIITLSEQGGTAVRQKIWDPCQIH